MTRQLFNWIILLVLTIGCISCNEQVKKDIPKAHPSESKITPAEQPKLIKTQGSGEGDNVHYSIQDKSGNLWFGTTSEGVYKYDGKSFKQFTVKDGLNSNMVYCILEDKEGKIWIGTENGVCFYNGKTFTKVQVDLPNNLPPNKNANTHNVFSILQDKSGTLWFSTIDGVYTYDGTSFMPFIVNEGASGYKSSNHNVENMLEDKAGNIWFGGRVNEGIFRYDGKTVTNFKLEELKGHNWAWPALQDKNGDIWFSNWGGAYRYDGKSFTTITKEDGLCNDSVTRIIEDKNGNLWFGSGGIEDGGISRYDRTSFTCFTTKEGLINNAIWSILEDNTGNLWIGTRDTGLSRYDGTTFTDFSERSLPFPSTSDRL